MLLPPIILKCHDICRIRPCYDFAREHAIYCNNSGVFISAPKKTRNLSKNKKVQFPKEVSDKLELLQKMEIEIEQNEASGKVDKGHIKRQQTQEPH